MSKKPHLKDLNLKAADVTRQTANPSEKFAQVTGGHANATQHLQPPLTIYELGRAAIADAARTTAPLPVRDFRRAGPIGIPVTSAQDIGQLVRTAREAQNLSQQSFADLAGVGRRFVSELENGKATLEFDKVLKVAAAAGIDMFARKR